MNNDEAGYFRFRFIRTPAEPVIASRGDRIEISSAGAEIAATSEYPFLYVTASVFMGFAVGSNYGVRNILANVIELTSIGAIALARGRIKHSQDFRDQVIRNQC